jgi:hypothetical protein
MTRDELEAASAELLGSQWASLTLDELFRLITATQHACDILLNEIERRGELSFNRGGAIMPYCSDYVVETVMDRDDDDPTDGSILPAQATHRAPYGLQ